jgi:hypothetical protein
MTTASRSVLALVMTASNRELLLSPLLEEKHALPL